MSDLSVSPGKVRPSEDVIVSVLVTNIGDTEGSYTVILKIDDKDETRKVVIIGAVIIWVLHLIDHHPDNRERITV